MSAIRQDVGRYAPLAQPLGILSAIGLVSRSYGLQALIAYRLGRWLLDSRRSWPLWPIAWPAYFAASRYARIAFDIELHLSAHIGPGLYIGHFGGIRVRHCRLGAHCSIAQSVEIGPSGSGAGPDIGDRVWIGAHAKIAGPFRIGDAGTVSAGSRVTREVPAGALVMGDPARIAAKVYDNRKLLVLDEQPP